MLSRRPDQMNMMRTQSLNNQSSNSFDYHDESIRREYSEDPLTARSLLSLGSRRSEGPEDILTARSVSSLNNRNPPNFTPNSEYYPQSKSFFPNSEFIPHSNNYQHDYNESIDFSSKTVANPHFSNTVPSQPFNIDNQILPNNNGIGRVNLYDKPRKPIVPMISLPGVSSNQYTNSTDEIVYSDNYYDLNAISARSGNSSKLAEDFDSFNFNLISSSAPNVTNDTSLFSGGTSLTNTDTSHRSFSLTTRESFSSPNTTPRVITPRFVEHVTPSAIQRLNNNNNNNNNSHDNLKQNIKLNPNSNSVLPPPGFSVRVDTNAEIDQQPNVSEAATLAGIGFLNLR